jgi:hypothetical protein
MATITPTFPLLLLETMRDMDRPTEVLEAEDLTISMPRRLGLSDVVLMQIQRLREEVRQRRPQTTDEVENLIRLVTRRPDAIRIFREASRRQAEMAWEARSAAVRRLVRVLPPALALYLARRASRRAFGELVGTRSFRIVGRPPAVRVEGSITAQADPGGTACTFYGGLLTEMLQHFTRQDWYVEHPECEARGGSACEWRARAIT